MGEPGQQRDLALVIHPHLADHHFGVVGHVVDAERAADQIVEIAPRLECAALAGHQRGDHFFGGGLAGRAGDGDEEKGIALANRSRELLQRDGGVVDLHDSFVCRDVLRHVRYHRAARDAQRLRHELVPVQTLALDGEEDGVGLDFA